MERGGSGAIGPRTITDRLTCTHVRTPAAIISGAFSQSPPLRVNPSTTSSILFRVNRMEACRMRGRQQLCIGTDDSQPQGLEFQCQCQM